MANILAYGYDTHPSYKCEKGLVSNDAASCCPHLVVVDAVGQLYLYIHTLGLSNVGWQH